MKALPVSTQPASKRETYELLIQQAKALIEGEPDLIANLANVAALIWQSLPDLNWAGFYLWKGNELVLGPFQGKPACVRIGYGKGVCGTAVARKATIVVEDVDQFPGHIVCDSASRSEIVVPMLRGGEILGVLDIDSPNLGRFDDADRDGLEKLIEVVVASV
jgi:L-methionine (R)-S-oxide reductase